MRAAFKMFLLLAVVGCSSTTGTPPDELDLESSSTTTSTTLPTTTTNPAPTTTLNPRPSQSPLDAERDGVVPELAVLPYHLRVETLLEVEADVGTWVLARPSEELVEASFEDGCALGNPESNEAGDVICTVEYGEILLVDETGEIANAFPMPGAVPSWILVTPTAVYVGHIGDGALPDSVIVRLDPETFDALVVVIPAPFDGNDSWPGGWHVAGPELTTEYEGLVGAPSEVEGTPVHSWIGDIVVDIEGIDILLQALGG